MSSESQDNSRDDEVLARLYKESAKEAAPAKLNYEVLKHAKNADRSVGGSSHFSGDWKVPLSLAASIVVVFGLFVQLDQHPERLDIPPIPEISVPTSPQQSKPDKDTSKVLNATEEIMTDSQFSNEADLETLEDTPIEKRSIEGSNIPGKQLETQPFIIQTKPSAKKNIEQKREVLREHQNSEVLMEKSKSSDTHHLESNTGNKEPLANETSNQTERATDTEIQHSGAQIEQEEPAYAPIPVEDWLLMIERLIARKDYAEAARQLQKFKQAHPKVNVEGLENKIP